MQQVGEEIFYQANKDIAEGKELLVWYGDTYDMFMGIPTGLKTDSNSSEKVPNSTPTTNSEFTSLKGLEDTRNNMIF